MQIFLEQYSNMIQILLTALGIVVTILIAIWTTRNKKNEGRSNIQNRIIIKNNKDSPVDFKNSNFGVKQIGEQEKNEHKKDD